MQLSLSISDLQSYVAKQLNNIFPDNNIVTSNHLNSVIDLTIDRVDYCFKNMVYERYNKDGETNLNHLYSDQYLVFLWFLSNTFWKEKQDNSIATKLYYLNKALHSFDCMFDTQLPDIFFISHGIGTMLGKAVYGDYFIAMHGCTIGTYNGKNPVIGKGVTLTAHSSVIGNCKIGNNVSISNYTSVFERDVPDNTLIFTDPNTGQVNLKPSRSTFAKQVFNMEKVIY